ncbi:MAG: OmpA family protein [Bacteroidaceae bacterium]|nr:OmpA family protein [Bacteroidaceae bacterium]
MKHTGIFTLLLCLCLVVSGCGSMNNTGKGALIGGGGGAALGGVVGALIGHGKGAAIGAAVGAAVGAGTGAIIGKKMDKKAEEAAKIANAQVEKVSDTNGLDAVKVTFDGGILFGFNSSALTDQSKKSLSELAKILKEDTQTDIAVYGHTDKVGTREANVKVSQNRADAVKSYLAQQGVTNGQFKFVEGKAFDEYDESKTAAENRRVEIYMYASEAMIKAAEAEAGN